LNINEVRTELKEKRGINKFELTISEHVETRPECTTISLQRDNAAAKQIAVMYEDKYGIRSHTHL